MASEMRANFLLRRTARLTRRFHAFFFFGGAPQDDRRCLLGNQNPQKTARPSAGHGKQTIEHSDAE